MSAVTEEDGFSPSVPERFNLATYLLDARIEEGNGDRLAVLTPTASYTYAEVLDRAQRLAGSLRRGGIVPGDRVLLVLPDGIDFVAGFFATLRIGAIGVMANPESPAGELEQLLLYTGCRGALVHRQVWHKNSALWSGLPLLLVAEETTPTSHSLAAACLTSPPDPVVAPTHRDDEALWLLTSGSTGASRAARHRHQDFACHVACYARRVLQLAAGDIVLAVPKLYFPYATGLALMFPFAVGACSVLFPEHPTPECLFALIERFRPTVLTSVPTMTAKLLADLSARRPDLSSLRLVISAGEALPPELYRRWKQEVGVEMLDGIGSAEMFHIYISNRPGDVRAGGLGRLVPGYRARVVRADGLDAGDDEVGTLWVTGPTVFLGYHDDPERTASVLRDGWVISGDFFRRDADGHYRYEGRADDMLKVGGIYVSPLEVENVLRQHAAVADCAVVGYEDGQGLLKPRAFVVPSPGQVADEALFALLAEWCRSRLARYKVPRSWVARPELPRNDRGKVMRRALRAE